MTVTGLSGDDVDAAKPQLRSPLPLTPSDRLLSCCIGLALPVALALLWEAGVRSGLITGRLMPPPSKIFSTLYALAQSGELWLHTSATYEPCARWFCHWRRSGDRSRGIDRGFRFREAFA